MMIEISKQADRTNALLVTGAAAPPSAGRCSSMCNAPNPFQTKDGIAIPSKLEDTAK